MAQDPILSPVRIKICGITSLEDALAAVEAGADMLGYNFYEGSARYLGPGACRRIHTTLLSRGLKTMGVGVFVNETPARIRRILEECGLEQAQLSGDETSEEVRQLNGRAFKALRPLNLEEANAQVETLPARATPPHFLLDAHEPGAYGGTGRTGDWEVAARLAARQPILLAGGLSPDNVTRAVRQVRPWGVDVASGVEARPGIKDPEKMRRFVQAARSVSSVI